MQADIKQKWIDALRSGEYTQGREKLRKEDKFCCLGVLCDVVGLESISYDDGYTFGYIYKEDEYFSFLPPKLVDDLRIPDFVEQTLIDMNDIEKRSFAEIADYIEKEL